MLKMTPNGSSKSNKKESTNEQRKIGFLVNPIAGVGGRIGLKGSDDVDVIREKINSGEGKKVANERAGRFLKVISDLKEEIKFLCFQGEMGSDILQKHKMNFEIIGQPEKEKTTRADTKRAANKFFEKGVKLIVFVGGDGTACDMYDAVNEKIPLLAVPAGVKMHSACFALNPEVAGTIFRQFHNGELNIKLAEVMDIDEQAFREGRLSAELKGMVKIPYLVSAIQGGKMASPSTADEKLDKKVIAQRVSEDMDKDVLYLLGPGTTCTAVADLLKLDKTLLGVDAIYNRELVGDDLNEEEILELLEKHSEARIIVTVIGNQGFIFGRGNQQFSPIVIRKVGIKNIILIATVNKLERTEKLRVDTGDPELDKELRGFIRVVTSYNQDFMMRIGE
jgi:predicted polyphosphate/ATP-dependent NAD kinase